MYVHCIMDILHSSHKIMGMGVLKLKEAINNFFS